MTCQLGKNIYHLRKKNRDLLEQLESNSVLLEDRIKKLAHTARTPRRSDKSWQDLPPSPLKRRYESWRARNSSGPVAAAALNSNLYCPSPDSSSSESSLNDEMRSKPLRGIPTKSPAKRSKRNVVIVSGIKKQPNNSRQSSTSKARRTKVASKERSFVKKKKPCKECYCPDYYIENKDSSDISVQEIEDIEADGEQHVKSREQGPETSHHHNRPSASNRSDVSRREKIKEARSVLDYSPKSVFLRRLKKHSQIKERFNDPVDHSVTDKKPTSTKGMENHSSDDLETSHDDQIENRTPKGAPRKNHVSAPNRWNAKKEMAPAPSKHTQIHDNGSERDEPKCQRTARKDSTSYHRKPLGPTDNCRCHCCRQQTMGGYDIIAGLVDNENQHRHVKETPCKSAWFDEMNRFRRSHWFDCHAHHPTSCTSLDANSDVRCSWFDNDLESRKHKCIHRYIMNDRMFPEPLYSDHLNNSRCPVCHLSSGPTGRGCKGPRQPHDVTLPSKPPTKDVLVTLPTATFKRDANLKVYPPSNIIVRDVAPAKKSSGSSPRFNRTRPASSKPTAASTKSVGRRPPVPTNSLALRYQKGVA